MSLSRRAFFKFTGAGAAAAGSATVASGALAAEEEVQATNAVLKYPAENLAKAGELKVNEPVSFNYPDNRSPCQLIKMGHEVPGGVGPDRDIVAYSTMCPHMGCPMQYEGDTRRFKCGCHFSVFDAEQAGQQVMGQATQDVPRIELVYNKDEGTVHAVGVHGLIFGRQANTL